MTLTDMTYWHGRAVARFAERAALAGNQGGR